MGLHPLDHVTSGETAMNLYAQLNFGGNCEEAFSFYEKHLGGKITMMMNQSQSPGAPSGAGKAIIHARMDIGDTVLIGNDVPPSVFHKMRSVYIYLSVDSTKEAESYGRSFTNVPDSERRLA
jgi:PhnB protein